MTGNEVVGWHHWLNGHEFEQTPGVGDGQGSLVCYNPWSCRVRHDLLTELNWTEYTDAKKLLYPKRHKLSVFHLSSKIRKWKSPSCVQLFVTPVLGILQARILDWVAIPSPGDIPNPGIRLKSPALQEDSLPAEPPGKPKNTGLGSLSIPSPADQIRVSCIAGGFFTSWTPRESHQKLWAIYYTLSLCIISFQNLCKVQSCTTSL